MNDKRTRTRHSQDIVPYILFGVEPDKDNPLCGEMVYMLDVQRVSNLDQAARKRLMYSLLGAAQEVMYIDEEKP